MKEKEFDMEGFLDSRKQVVKAIGFFEESYAATIRKMVMKSHKRKFINEYYLENIISNGDKVILEWKRRVVPPSEGEMNKIFDTEKTIQFTEKELRDLVSSVTEFVSHNEPDEYDEWFEKKIALLKENK